MVNTIFSLDILKTINSTILIRIRSWMNFGQSLGTIYQSFLKIANTLGNDLIGLWCKDFAHAALTRLENV